MVEPLPELSIQVAVPEELASVDEALPHIRDQALDLALRLRPLGFACPHLEAPVGCEANELGVRHELLPVQPAILRDDRLHLVEEPFHRLAAKRRLNAFQHEGFWACLDTFKDRQLLEEMDRDGRAPWQLWKRRDASAQPDHVLVER